MILNTDITWQRFTFGSPPVDLRPIGEAEYIAMDISIIPDWNVSIYMEWDPPLEDPELSFVVYYSESEFGPFTQLTPQPLTDTFFFTRWQVQDSKVYNQFFTVEIIDSTGKRYRSYPKTPNVDLPGWHRLRHKDIIRREAILLDKFVGIESVIFNRKRRGPHCPVCWDRVHKVVVGDHCEACFSTSFEGGYDTGMRTKLQYMPMDPVHQFSYNGSQEPTVTSVWGLPFPIIHPKSIILRMGDRKIFNVEGYQGNTELMTNIQRQNLIIKELSKDSIEKKLFNRTDIIDIPVRVPHVHH